MTTEEFLQHQPNQQENLDFYYWLAAYVEKNNPEMFLATRKAFRCAEPEIYARQQKIITR